MSGSFDNATCVPFISYWLPNLYMENDSNIYILYGMPQLLIQYFTKSTSMSAWLIIILSEKSNIMSNCLS